MIGFKAGDLYDGSIIILGSSKYEDIQEKISNYIDDKHSEIWVYLFQNEGDTTIYELGKV